MNPKPSYDDLADTVSANLRVMRSMGDNMERLVGLSIIALCVIVAVASVAIITRTVREIK